MPRSSTPPIHITPADTATIRLRPRAAQHRQDGQCEQRVANDFQNRRVHVAARPPRTWAAQNALGAGAAQSTGRGIVMAAPLNSLVQSKDSPLRFQPVDPSQRQKLRHQAQSVQQYGEQRQRLETGVAARPGEQPTRPLSPGTAKLPLSPIVARPNAELAKDHVPPETHVAPKPDLTVEAKPRAVRSPEQPQPRTVNRLPLDTPQPNPQPRAERPATQPQPQPRAERPAPQPQPRADRSPPEPAAGRPAAGPKQENDKNK